jgi:hypothetical protein
MRQKTAKPWEALGISRATWYRYGKPTEKAVYEDLKWEKGGPGSGTLADCADDLKKFGFPSTRTYQRVMRVRLSPLWPYVERGEVSIAKADRSLADPEFMRHFHNVVAEAEVAEALKLFEQERRNDVSAEAIAAHLNKPVEIVIEALRRLGVGQGRHDDDAA